MFVVFLLSETFEQLGVPVFILRAYMMKVIPSTGRVH